MLPPLRSLLLLCLALLLAPLAAPQQSPSRPPPAPADQEQIVPYWTTETGWTSELQLRNNQVGLELTVTPVLRTAYGAETTLAPVTIKPRKSSPSTLNRPLAPLRHSSWEPTAPSFFAIALQVLAASTLL
jgi:hypothetical protein